MRKLGQGRARKSSLPATKAPVSSVIYRAFTHKTEASCCESVLRRSFSPCNSNHLAAAFFCIGGTGTPRISTHSFPYIYSYRDSTHFHTVTPPTLLAVHSPSAGQGTAHSYVFKRPTHVTRSIVTVLSPTFSPFFQSFCYRSSNHGPTVLLPTETGATTVLSPTKLPVKHLNLHRSFSGKDVFKICIKKTSGLMRLFFILVFFSSRWRLSHS
jgi:hypothetical protein